MTSLSIIAWACYVNVRETRLLLKPHTRSHKHLEIRLSPPPPPSEGGSISPSMAPSHKGKKIGSYSIAFNLNAVKYHLDGHTKSHTSLYSFILPPPPSSILYPQHATYCKIQVLSLLLTYVMVRYFPILSCICSSVNDLVEYLIH